MLEFLNILSVSIFPDLSIWKLTFLAIVYTCAFMVRGVLGIGAMPILVLIGALLLETHHAVLLAMLVVMYTQIMFLRESLRHGDWRLVFLLAIGYAPTVILGVWIFERLTSNWLGIVVGLLLFFVILADNLIPQKRIQYLARQVPRFGIVAIAALSGVFSGIVGAGSLIMLSLFLKALYTEARIFRATILLISILGSIWRFGIQCSTGLITMPLLAESLIMAPFAFLGSYLGIRIFKSILSDNYFRTFRYFLLFAALIIVIRGLINIY